MNDRFKKGFKYELKNRHFALKAVEKIANKLAGTQSNDFWESYLLLEQFNEPRYHAASEVWRVKPKTYFFAKLKASLISLTPNFMLNSLVKLVYRETLKYMVQLREISKLGPPNSRAFLNYMLEQEQVQIDMMKMALEGKTHEIRPLVDNFISKNKLIPLKVAFDALD